MRRVRARLTALFGADTVARPVGPTVRGRRSWRHFVWFKRFKVRA
jgi:hypothetical protein